jgi:hypothetical protein
MVVKRSARVEELLATAAELAPEERQAFVEGLAVGREHTTAADARHAELLRRVEGVRRGEARAAPATCWERTCPRRAGR